MTIVRIARIMEHYETYNLVLFCYIAFLSILQWRGVSMLTVDSVRSVPQSLTVVGLRGLLSLLRSFIGRSTATASLRMAVKASGAPPRKVSPPREATPPSVSLSPVLHPMKLGDEKMK